MSRSTFGGSRVFVGTLVNFFEKKVANTAMLFAKISSTKVIPNSNKAYSSTNKQTKELLKQTSNSQKNSTSENLTNNTQRNQTPQTELVNESFSSITPPKDPEHDLKEPINNACVFDFAPDLDDDFDDFELTDSDYESDFDYESDSGYKTGSDYETDSDYQSDSSTNFNLENEKNQNKTSSLETAKDMLIKNKEENSFAGLLNKALLERESKKNQPTEELTGKKDAIEENKGIQNKDKILGDQELKVVNFENDTF